MDQTTRYLCILRCLVCFHHPFPETKLVSITFHTREYTYQFHNHRSHHHSNGMIDIITGSTHCSPISTPGNQRRPPNSFPLGKENIEHRSLKLLDDNFAKPWDIPSLPAEETETTYQDNRRFSSGSKNREKLDGTIQRMEIEKKMKPNSPTTPPKSNQQKYSRKIFYKRGIQY